MDATQHREMRFIVKRIAGAWIRLPAVGHEMNSARFVFPKSASQRPAASTNGDPGSVRIL